MFSSTGRIQAVTLEVNQGNSTCIKAELTASFSITYNTSNGTVWTMTTTICFPSLKAILLIVYPHPAISFVSPQRTVQVPLPDSATVDAGSSSCGLDGNTPWLVAVFGPGHALGLSFSTNGSLYSVANLTLQYNLSDTSVFPEANSSGENKFSNKLSVQYRLGLVSSLYRQKN